LLRIGGGFPGSQIQFKENGSRERCCRSDWPWVDSVVISISCWERQDKLKRLIEVWRSPNSLRINRLASLSLLLMVMGTLAPAPNPSGAHAYLARQAAALRPAFRADLEALADAPRYTIQASIDPESGSLAGQMRLDYTNTTGETLREVTFRLFPNAKTIYGGGSLSVESVTAGGAPLKSEPSEDGTVLRIPLARPLAPAETLSMDLTFSAQVPRRTSQGYGIFNRSLGVLTLAGWYPILAIFDGDGWSTPPLPATGDAMFAESSFYEVSLRVPAGYQVVSTGSRLGQEQKGGEVTWHLVSGPAREFAVAVSDRFQTLETRADEVTLRLHTLPADGPVVAPADGLYILTETFATYVDRFGPYPFVEFDLVEAVVPIDGYEFSGMAYVDYAKRTRETRPDYRYTVAHEVAHQWWYGLVGNRSVHEPWLDESLATYSALINLENIQGAEASERLVAHWLDTDGPRGPEDPPVNSSALTFSTWAPYHATVYMRGALFLNELRGELGQKKFFELFGRYQKEYRYQMATSEDFLSLAEEVAGRDLDPLFAKWFDIDAARGMSSSTAGPSSASSEINVVSPKPRYPPRNGGPVD
jgi:hypothetical protein